MQPKAKLARVRRAWHRPATRARRMAAAQLADAARRAAHASARVQAHLHDVVAGPPFFLLSSCTAAACCAITAIAACLAACCAALTAPLPPPPPPPAPAPPLGLLAFFATAGLVSSGRALFAAGGSSCASALSSAEPGRLGCAYTAAGRAGGGQR